MIIFLVRGIYAALASIALAFEVAPWTREAFVRYGKTRSDPAEGDGTNKRRLHQQAPRSAPETDLLSWFSQQTVPKNWFWHFYLVGAVVGCLVALDLLGRTLGQTRSLLDLCSEMVPVTYLRQSLALKQSVDGGIENSPGSIKSPHMAALLTLLMYIIHVALRLKETVRDQPKTDARMHIGQYGVGIIYYIVTPLAVVADAYCVPGWTMPPVWAALAGIALYIYASVHQWRCHHILYRLRSRAMVRQSIEHKYVVPDGDLFSLVSCPHFLCEIVIYVSIWTAAGFQATTLVWTICWTVVNLGITARETQQWYRQKFGPEYPQGRKALVPYVW